MTLHKIIPWVMGERLKKKKHKNGQKGTDVFPLTII
jgi:hypothetical protein